MNIKKLSALLSFLAVLAFPALSLAQQNSLIQTTLAAAVAAPATLGTTAPVPFGTVTLASTTSIVASSLNSTGTLNTQNLWVIFVDREEMAVVSVNGTTLQVIRGYNSTVASAHVSGQMVLYGKAAWFYQTDPGGSVNTSGVGGGTCVLANVVATPWVNVRTGSQWVCSALTLTWAPSWNNPLANPASWVQTGTIASVAGATTVSGPYFNISGTNTITSFTIPLGFNATAFGGGCFTANPTGIWTWTAAGNIATAGTTTAATTPVTFCWNAASSKWIPSRLA